MNKTKTILAAVFTVIGLMGALAYLSTVRAADSTGQQIIKQLQEGAGSNGADLPAPRDPRIVAATIIRSALGLLGIIFTALIVYAGFVWMTAGGNDENVKKAKGYIFNAIIGLLLILSAYGITFFVFKLGLSSYGDRCSGKNQCDKDEKCNLYGMCVDSYWCENTRDCDNLGSTFVCRNGGCTTAEDLGDYFD